MREEKNTELSVRLRSLSLFSSVRLFFDRVHPVASRIGQTYIALGH